MEAETIIKLTFEDLMNFTADAVAKGLEKFRSDQVEEKLLSQSQARKMLKVGDKRLKELIYSGQLKTTENGKIYNHSIHNYLKGDNK